MKDNIVVIEDPINPVDEVQGLETITHLPIPTKEKQPMKDKFDAKAFTKGLGIKLIAQDEHSITVDIRGIAICIGTKQGEESMRKALRYRGVKCLKT